MSTVFITILSLSIQRQTRRKKVDIRLGVDGNWFPDIRFLQKKDETLLYNEDDFSEHFEDDKENIPIETATENNISEKIENATVETESNISKKIENTIDPKKVANSHFAKNTFVAYLEKSTAVETVTESNASETVTENAAVETVTESNASEKVTEIAVETVTESNASEKVTEIAVETVIDLNAAQKVKHKPHQRPRYVVPCNKDNHVRCTLAEECIFEETGEICTTRDSSKCICKDSGVWTSCTEEYPTKDITHADAETLYMKFGATRCCKADKDCTKSENRIIHRCVNKKGLIAQCTSYGEKEESINWFSVIKNNFMVIIFVILIFSACACLSTPIFLSDRQESETQSMESDSRFRKANPYMVKDDDGVVHKPGPALTTSLQASGIVYKEIQKKRGSGPLTKRTTLFSNLFDSDRKEKRKTVIKQIFAPLNLDNTNDEKDELMDLIHPPDKCQTKLIDINNPDMLIKEDEDDSLLDSSSDSDDSAERIASSLKNLESPKGSKKINLNEDSDEENNENKMNSILEPENSPIKNISEENNNIKLEGNNKIEVEIKENPPIKNISEEKNNNIKLEGNNKIEVEIKENPPPNYHDDFSPLKKNGLRSSHSTGVTTMDTLRVPKSQGTGILKGPKIPGTKLSSQESPKKLLSQESVSVTENVTPGSRKKKIPENVEKSPRVDNTNPNEINDIKIEQPEHKTSKGHINNEITSISEDGIEESLVPDIMSDIMSDFSEKASLSFKKTASYKRRLSKLKKISKNQPKKSIKSPIKESSEDKNIEILVEKSEPEKEDD